MLFLRYESKQKKWKCIFDTIDPHNDNFYWVDKIYLHKQKMSVHWRCHWKLYTHSKLKFTNITALKIAFFGKLNQISKQIMMRQQTSCIADSKIWKKSQGGGQLQDEGCHTGMDHL